jgi:lipoprotein NlpD
VLIGAAGVVLAFIIGHASGGGSSGSAAVTSQTTGAAVTTTTLPATHTVAAGESLSSIATIYALSPQELAAYNNISNVNHVSVGEVLRLPPPSTATTPTTKKK